MFTKILKDKNLSVTKQRILILGALHVLRKPATIETIKLHIQSDIDIATLYRSLSALVGKGIVYQTDFREGVAYYELQSGNHHHHLVCTTCKSKTSFEYCPKIPVIDVEKKTGFHINNHIFEIFGICKKCIK